MCFFVNKRKFRLTSWVLVVNSKVELSCIVLEIIHNGTLKGKTSKKGKSQSLKANPVNSN